MESDDSDEDFMSADEGDDEVINNIPPVSTHEVIHEESKTEVVHEESKTDVVLKDEKTDTGGDEQRVREDDVVHRASNVTHHRDGDTKVEDTSSNELKENNDGEMQDDTDVKQEDDQHVNTNQTENVVVVGDVVVGDGGGGTEGVGDGDGGDDGDGCVGGSVDGSSGDGGGGDGSDDGGDDGGGDDGGDDGGGGAGGGGAGGDGDGDADGGDGSGITEDNIEIEKDTIEDSMLSNNDNIIVDDQEDITQNNIVGVEPIKVLVEKEFEESTTCKDEEEKMEAVVDSTPECLSDAKNDSVPIEPSELNSNYEKGNEDTKTNDSKKLDIDSEAQLTSNDEPEDIAADDSKKLTIDSEAQLKSNVEADDGNIETNDPKSVTTDKLVNHENKEMEHEKKAESVEPLIETLSNSNLTEHNVDSGSLEESTPVDVPSKKKVESNTNKTTESVDDSWGWDSWADNFISQATTKVTTLMETVEGQLGIPDPVHVAQTLKEETSKIQNKEQESNTNMDDGKTPDVEQKVENTSSWFSSFVPVASITNIVQNRGQELVSSGIGALEFIGKSTVDYLSEGDPGLRNKRKALFKQRGQTLSSILQEAKIKADDKDNSVSITAEDPKRLNDMLEKYQAIAHLDAVQMLSASCETKLKRILNVQSETAKEESIQILTEIRNNFELDENEECNFEDVDFKKEVFASTKKLKMKVTCSKLLNTWSKLKEKTDVMDFEDSEKCFENCICLLAELISRYIEYYRKIADMLIMTDLQAKQLATERASILKSITELFQYEVSGLSNKFANYLANNEQDTTASDYITDIYMESANCSSLLHDSHMLILPLLQCSAIK